MDGEKFQYVSGAFHYFRQDPSLWETTIKKMANGGLNVLETYVAWNVHEPEKGQFVWDGRADIEAFLELCAKYNMYVILRPGPYICAEWDFGGFPYWLMNCGAERLRTNDPLYMQHVNDWFKVLYPRIAKYMYVNGGPIIMVQIENEYGSYFACDKEYLKALCDLALEYLGSETVLFTVDMPYDLMAYCGAIPELALATIDFGTDTDVQARFEQQREWNYGKGPYVNTEYYTGWLDWWGEEHQTVPADRVAAHLDEMLALGGNVNMYMYYGGTNFDYMTGANFGDTGVFYLPDPTSYDYDAPLSEAGDLTDKYWKILEVIKKYRSDIPVYDVENSTKKAYKSITLSGGISLLDALDDVTTSVTENETPLSFEDLKNGFGFVLYETTCKYAGKFMIPHVADRAVIYKNGQDVDTIYLAESKHVDVQVGDKIQILVEHLGRANWDLDLLVDRKGFRGTVTIEGVEAKDWTMRTIPLSSAPSHLKFVEGSLPVHQPAFFRGYFDVDEVADTFVNPTGFKHGVVWINGHHIGRYWSAGPQLTLYVRSCYLQKGQNEIIIFESGDLSEVPEVGFDDHATLDMPPGPFTGSKVSGKRRPGHK